MKVRVLSVQRVRDIRSGGNLYQITFGDIAELTDELKNRITQYGQNVPVGGDEIAIPSLIVTAPYSSPPPYRIDSEWELTVSPNGSISLRKPQS